MTTELNGITWMGSALASALFGGKIAIFVGQVVTGDDMPMWMKYLLGPMGALIGLMVALKWMNQRLDKAEAKIEKKEEERDGDRKLLIEVLAKTNDALDRTSECIEKSTKMLEHTKKSVDMCHAKNNQK